MRLRLVHQLSLLLMGAVLLAVVAVGGAVLWNLRAGFADYLRQREVEQLDSFAQLVTQRAQADPSMAWLAGSREAMRDLVVSHQMLEGQTPDRPDRPEAPPPRRPPPRPGSEPNDQGPPPHGVQPTPPDGPPGAPPPPPQGGIAGRVQIFDANGAWLAGRSQPPDGKKISRPVVVGDVTVARVELTLTREPAGLDAGFLRRQYQGLALVASAVLLLALLVAWAVARRWSLPLRSLQATAQRLARGDWTPQPATPSGAAEIVNLGHDLREMGQSLARMERSRKMWIAQISHELRTPLSVLLGEIEALQDGIRQPTPAMLASLREEILQLTRLVGDLHTLSVADLGRLPLSPTPGDANACLQAATARYSTRAAKQGLELTWTQSATPIAVQWDFGRIDQLLCNLLENALRYTSSPGCIQVGWQLKAGLLQLVVQDSAPGVAPEHLGHLFEPLYRVDSARTRPAQGQGEHSSGLGLSIARAIVQAHGGTISAEPSALGGLAICVRLPLQAHA